MSITRKSVQQWKRLDIDLTGTKTYANPFLDVQIDSVFIHESGAYIALPGFWKGGDQWCVRFAPTLPGKWTYTITCTDAENAGLQQQGILQATANKGTTQLDKKGWIRLDGKKRYFVYDDGTPFFWLGDTHWQMPDYERTDTCNFPGCSCGNQFEHLLQDRLKKGFNVYQTYPDAGENDGGGLPRQDHWWKEKYTLIDPDGFNANFDKKMDRLAEAGMTVALGMGVHTSTPTTLGEEAFLQFTRYMVARYASYPVAWITAQEITLSMKYDQFSYNIYKKIGALISALDGYHHPMGTHLCPQTFEVHKDLDRQPWHQWWALQAGHGNVASIKPQSFYESYWKSPSRKLYMETESQYEDLGFGRNGYESSRIAGWKAAQCGSYGFTYGAVGIWGLRWSDHIEDGGWSTSYNSESWYMALNKPGSFEMGYMRAFYEKVGFEKLIPRFADKRYASFDDPECSVLSSNGSTTYVVYFYNPSTLTGTLQGMYKRKSYRAYWYDPRTGKYILICNDMKASDGTYAIPRKPTPQDWVLLITAETLNDLPTEAVPLLWLAPPIGNPVHPKLKIAAVSCNSTMQGYSADHILDDNPDTFWRAYSYSGSNTLLMDLGAKKTISYAKLTFPADTVYQQKYRLDGSADGEDWSILCDRTMQPMPLQKAADGTVTLSEELFGSCRFLRLLIFGFKQHEDQQIPIVLSGFEVFGE